MKDYEVDTAAEYDDLVDFVENQNRKSENLGEFLGEGDEYTPTVRAKTITDAEFSESWQRLIVNIEDLNDLAEFTRISGIVITPKTDEIIYEHNPEPSGLLNFLDGE